MPRNPIEDYELAHYKMVKFGIPIRPDILRRYLDTVRMAKANAVGQNYAKRLIITGQWLNDPEIAHEIFETAIDHSWEIVAGK